MSFKSLAQAGVPVSLRPDFNRMGQMSNTINMAQMMNQRWYYGMDYQINKEYKFKVMMKDSSVKEIKSKIYVDTTTHKSYLMFIDKSVVNISDPQRYKKVYCNQTLSITRSEGIINFTGNATDSCWLFRVLRGKINAYSPLSEIENIDSSYLRAFQVGNGSIQKLDSAALAPVIKDDDKAYKAFMKKDFYKAIRKYDGF